MWKQHLDVSKVLKFQHSNNWQLQSLLTISRTIYNRCFDDTRLKITGSAGFLLVGVLKTPDWKMREAPDFVIPLHTTLRSRPPMRWSHNGSVSSQANPRRQSASENNLETGPPSSQVRHTRMYLHIWTRTPTSVDNFATTSYGNNQSWIVYLCYNATRCG